MLRSDRFAVGWPYVALLLTATLAALVAAPVAAQALSLGELSALCARAEANAGVGVDAAFCDWYALPCDCKLTDPGRSAQSAPRWCLPEDALALEAARARVLAEVRQLQAPSQPAEPAIAAILVRLYPCPGD